MFGKEERQKVLCIVYIIQRAYSDDDNDDDDENEWRWFKLHLKISTFDIFRHLTKNIFRRHILDSGMLICILKIISFDSVFFLPSFRSTAINAALDDFRDYCFRTRFVVQREYNSDLKLGWRVWMCARTAHSLLCMTD